MVASLAFYSFLLLVLYVIYWSFKNDDESEDSDGKNRKSKFTMEDARARRDASRGDDRIDKSAS